MSQNKTLIAYETKQGASKGAAERIANVLRSKYKIEVDVVDLNKQDVTDLSKYQNVVAGAGVRGGRIYGKTLEFLKSDLTGKRVAFYVSSSWAGTPGSYKNAKTKFVDKTLVKYPKVNFVSSGAFGGRIHYFGKTMLDNTDPAKVNRWAEELGKKFTE
jgi:menaquinone-dependent protoporphyrinogen IX oxidase